MCVFQPFFDVPFTPFGASLSFENRSAFGVSTGDWIVKPFADTQPEFLLVGVDIYPCKIRELYTKVTISLRRPPPLTWCAAVSDPSL